MAHWSKGEEGITSMCGPVNSCGSTGIAVQNGTTSGGGATSAFEASYAANSTVPIPGSVQGAGVVTALQNVLAARTQRIAAMQQALQ